MFGIERRLGRITVGIFMTGPRLFRIVFAPVAVLFCTSCAELEKAQQTATDALKAAAAPFAGRDYWNGDGVPGSAKIVVHLGEQRAYFYKGKLLVGESTVSTGKRGFSTPPGRYRVGWKHKDHISTLYGDYVDDAGSVVKPNVDSRKDRRPPGTHFDGARMPYAMFFRGGYAMHEGYVPPHAASHGCIRLPHGMAQRFFDAAPPGTPVVVKE